MPVIIISADATPPQIARLLGAGARDYLTKPFDVHRFLAVLDATLFQASASPREPLENADATSQATPQKVKSLRILVAEDNLVNQKIVAHQLCNLGHHPTIHDNGYEIIQAWQSGHFDLILMDCHMPRLDGYATTREIRLQEAERAADGLSRRPRIPIVALTANAVASDREKASPRAWTTTCANRSSRRNWRLR
ncbi:MAG TPA: response regulator [Abditibacterium sp.]